jgi:hypothetical protein
MPQSEKLLFSPDFALWPLGTNLPSSFLDLFLRFRLAIFKSSTNITSALKHSFWFYQKYYAR